MQFYILNTKGDSLSRTSIRYSYPDPFRRRPPNDRASSRKRRSNQHVHQFMSEQMRCFHRQRLHQASLHLLGHYPMSDHSKQQQALPVHIALCRQTPSCLTDLSAPDQDHVKLRGAIAVIFGATVNCALFINKGDGYYPFYLAWMIRPA